MTAEFKQINDRFDRLERLALLSAKSVLNMDEAALFTGLSKGHLYRLTSNKQIPHSKKNRKLYFSKQKLEEWMLDNEVLTKHEINSEAETYIATHRRFINH